MAAGSMFSKLQKQHHHKDGSIRKSAVISNNAEELEDFVYDIENGSAGFKGAGGSAKEVTVEEFRFQKASPEFQCI